MASETPPSDDTWSLRERDDLTIQVSDPIEEARSKGWVGYIDAPKVDPAVTTVVADKRGNVTVVTMGGSAPAVVRTHKDGSVTVRG